MNLRKHIYNIYSIIAAAVLTVAACACSPTSPDPGQWVDIDPAGWAYGQNLSFEPPADTCCIREGVQPDSIARTSKLALSIRHTDAYPYANLWLEMSYPTGDTVMTDTLNIQLADPYGKWLGKGLGPSCQRTDTIVTRRRINDKPTIKLRHIMRTDTLREIEQIGLKIISR